MQLPKPEKRQVPDLGMPRLELIADGDYEFVLDILDMYLENCTRFLSEIDWLVAEQNLEKIGQYGHKLRAGFTMLNFLSLHESLLRLEKSLPGKPDGLQNFKVELEESMSTIELKKEVINRFFN